MEKSGDNHIIFVLIVVFVLLDSYQLDNYHHGDTHQFGHGKVLNINGKSKSSDKNYKL